MIWFKGQATALLICACRAPLCAAVQSQIPMELISMLTVPCKKYRGGLGIGELEKNASALAYAMQLGQHEVVTYVSPQTFIATCWPAIIASTPV